MLIGWTPVKGSSLLCMVSHQEHRRVRHVTGCTQGRQASKHMLIMALPPTETNLYLHVCRAHLQTMMWKEADQQGPPNVDITKFAWEVTAGIPSPCIATGLAVPQGLCDVINSGCKAEEKACSTEQLRGVIAATRTTCRALSSGAFSIDCPSELVTSQP